MGAKAPGSNHPFQTPLKTDNDGNDATMASCTQHVQECPFHHERRRLLKHEKRVFCY